MMTKDQIDVLKQSERVLYSKLEILDKNNFIIRELTGFLRKGSYRIKAKTGMRRTCDISLHVSNEVAPSPHSPIWVNKKFRTYIGIMNILTDEVVWFPIGTFAISKPTQDISITSENTLNIKGVDFTAFIDGTLGGSLTNNVIINSGDYIHNALQNIINEFTNFPTNIQQTEFKIPYKIEKNDNDELWDLLEEIINLYLHYEGFFDIWGTFVYQKSSDLISDSVVWDFSVPENNFIQSASIDYNWDEIRNRVVVSGRDKNGICPRATAAAVSSIKAWADCPYTIDKLAESTAANYKIPDTLITKAWNNIQAATTDKQDELLYKFKQEISKNGWDKKTGVEKTLGTYIYDCIYGISMLPRDLKRVFDDCKLTKEFDEIVNSKEFKDASYNPRSIAIKNNDYYTTAQCVTASQFELDKRLSGSELIRLSVLPIYGLDVNQLIYLDMQINDTPVVGKYCIDEISCELSESGRMDISCHKVTKARYTFDQTILHQKDPENWQYEEEVTTDDLNKPSGTPEPTTLSQTARRFVPALAPNIVLNNILDPSLVRRYSLTFHEQKDISDAIIFTRDTNHRIHIVKTMNDAYLALEGKMLYRDESRNWFTDSHWLGADLVYNAGWLGTPSPLPSYWQANNVSYKLFPENIVELETYLPSCFIKKFKLTEEEAKELTWVGLCYSRRAETAHSNNTKNYLEARVTKDGPVLNIMETYGVYTPLFRDENGNWYSDKYAYGQNLFIDKGWVGTISDKTRYPFDEEEKGLLRIDYENTMAGKNDILRK